MTRREWEWRRLVCCLRGRGGGVGLVVDAVRKGEQQVVEDGGLAGRRHLAVQQRSGGDLRAAAAAAAQSG